MLKNYLEFKSKRQSDGTREKYDTKVYTKILGTRDKKDYWKKYGDQYFEGVRPRKGRDVPDSISLTENKEDIYKLKTKHITSKMINKWLDKLVKLPVGDDYKKKTKNLLYNILKYSHQKYKSINLVEFDFLKDIKIKK